MIYTHTDAILKELNDNGFLKIGNFFTENEINTLKTETNSIIN